MAKERLEDVCPLCLLMKTFRNHPVAKHLRSARREVLLAVRSVLDARIEALEEDEPKTAKKVEVK